MILCAVIGLLVGFLAGTRVRVYELKTVTRSSYRSSFVHVYRINKLTGRTWEKSGTTWKRIVMEAPPKPAAQADPFADIEIPGAALLRDGRPTPKFDFDALIAPEPSKFDPDAWLKANPPPKEATP